MTLGNMRANSARTLAAWCLGRGCNHFRVLDVSSYPDDLPVPSFGPRLRCDRCGHLGADARPNWGDRAPAGALIARDAPKNVMKVRRSYTGQFLASVLGRLENKRKTGTQAAELTPYAINIF
jgi:hypothetical protein